MTYLQQTCHDMLNSQILLEQFSIEQHVSLRQGDMSRAHGCGRLIQMVKTNVAMQGMNLQRHQAANDEPVPGEAA